MTSSAELIVAVRLLRDGARVPYQASEMATGWDLYACVEEDVLLSQRPALIGTGIALAVPRGWDAQVRPRSGLARNGVIGTFGTLDADYRGELMVTLYTTAPDIEHTVRNGDRIAQLVFARVAQPLFQVVDALDETARGAGGHGEHRGMNYAWILAGAIAGAPLRYFVQGHVQDWSGAGFPWGTFAVNVSGCVVFGLLATLAEERGWLGREGRLLLLTGFLGSYTTFSTFGWETYELLRDDRVARAVLYAGGSAVLGVLGTWLGSVTARSA